MYIYHTYNLLEKNADEYGNFGVILENLHLPKNLERT